MQVLDRLKMELSNQEYLSEDQYIQYLIENNLNPNGEYHKDTMQKQLLLTVVDILEAVSNDIDTMTSISTEFSDIGQAYQFIEARISQLKDKIASIPDKDEEYNCFSLMYSRGVLRKNYTEDAPALENSDINSIVSSFTDAPVMQKTNSKTLSTSEINSILKS